MLKSKKSALARPKRAPDVSKSATSLNTESRVKKRPSRHLAELALSVGERLALESQNKRPVEIIERFDTSDHEYTVPSSKPLFQPYPTAVVLQNFAPFETYEVVLTFRNMDKFTRQFRIEPTVGAFGITRWESESLHSGRIASGMEVTFVVRFTPEEHKDHAYDLVCVTEREKFVVPLRAIGARAVLDFPDSIAFPDSAVRHNTNKTLLVRNVGNHPARFVIETKSPFQATPSFGYLDVNANMQIDVSFSPSKIGKYDSEMSVKYDSGEEVNVQLIAVAEDVDIRLERNFLNLDSTYITRASMKTIRIKNRSDIMAHYRWKKFATDSEEEQFRLRHRLSIANEESEQRDELELDTDLSLAELCVLGRRFKNKHRDVERNKLLFDDDIIMLEPIEGKIYPNSYVDVTVIFKPVMASIQQLTIFCEVSGRETRLPLQIKGEGVGPKARFSYDLLDIEDVFIDSKHKYEVVMENQGEIAVDYSAQPSNTLFGPKFKFSPSRGRLEVGEEQKIEITFSSDTLGEFSEDFLWRLEGSPQLLLLGVRGRVMGPTFHFDQKELNFGTISYKFTYTRNLTLTNTSRIPMTFRLRILDGRQDVGQEFKLDHTTGTIAAGEAMPISIEFTPSAIRKYDSALVVDVEGVGTDVHRLAISGESVVPSIILRNPLLDYGDSFLCNTYRKTVELANETDYPAHYALRTQESTAKGVYAYGSDQSEGIIEAQSVKLLNVDVEIKRVGPVNFPVFIVIAGNDDVPLGVDISACGQGPNVLLSTNELNWGKINVLKEFPMELIAHNDSPIPASFNCSTVSETSMFRVHPSVGVIPPGAKIHLTVVAFLDDCLKFTDILRVVVQSGALHEVQLVARGQGSTITIVEGVLI